MELSAELRALLEKKALGHVVTVNENGNPQVTLVWMGLHDGKPSFNTGNARVKGRNLLRDPRVVVSVQDPDAPGNYAVITGKAVITPDPTLAHLNGLARKFTGADYAYLQPGEERIAVDIDVTRVGGLGPWVA